MLVKQNRTWLFLVSLMLMAAGCGSSTPQPTTPKSEASPDSHSPPQTSNLTAASLNLTVADLSNEWTLHEEKASPPAEGTSNWRDLDERAFQSESDGRLMSIVGVVEEEAEAKQAVLVLGAVSRGMFAARIGAKLTKLDSPGVGQYSALDQGQAPDGNLSGFLLAFRKSKVVVILALVSKTGAVDKDKFIALARKLEAKIP